MTSKQRAYLRGLANTLQPIFQIGKSGLSDNLIKQLDDALEARECVQTVGSKITLYRAKKKDSKIVLP